MTRNRAATVDNLPITTNGHSAPVLEGEIDDDNALEGDYRVSVNLRRMTWGDNMIHARFQLLVETIGDVDGENSTQTERVAALRELLAGFDELTAYLNRVAKVTKDGVPVPFKDVPMDFVKEVMDAISGAQRRQGNPKN